MKTTSLFLLVGGGYLLANMLDGGGNDNLSELPSGGRAYFEKFDKAAAVAMLIDKMRKGDVTNKYLQAGILAVISKESAMRPQSEQPYVSSSPARIRQIFRAYRTKSDGYISAIKQDPKRFFDEAYAGIMDNGPHDGYRYRGRGFNQLTGKSNYALYGRLIGRDLLANPDQVNQLGVAAEVAVAYFRRSLEKAPDLHQRAYHFSHINSFKTALDAANAAYNANAGWGKKPDQLKNDPTGGYKQTLERYPGFLAMVNRA